MALPGIEPGRPEERQILSLLRLPVPPEGQLAAGYSIPRAQRPPARSTSLRTVSGEKWAASRTRRCDTAVPGLESFRAFVTSSTLRHVACSPLVVAGAVPLEPRRPQMIRTIAAVLAAFALVSFNARAEDKPADAKADAKAEKKDEKKADKKAKKAAKGEKKAEKTEAPAAAPAK